ncbi:MAG: glycosyltransferase family 2 protein [Saprospiraceae bacterium]|nr:glycosyltransferase family 2 protein [Saprospiraceae bacterium]MDG2418706.1 glycosyltransferase family 2 protein [Saprospiraceae bacterium]
MKRNLISILLPVRNAGKFLSACIESIQNQTETNWELIAIDDNSTDSSFEILSLFSRKLPEQIHVFKNEGKGIIPALRLAYSKCQGEFITRMDADDLMEKNKLASLRSLLVKNGRGHVATGLVKYFSETKLGEGYKKYEGWLNSLILENKSYDDIYKECVIPSPSWMCYQDDLEKCGAFEIQQYPEDYDLCFRFYKHNLKVVASKNVIHYWRDYSNRTSRTDPNYANQHYFELKLPYFLELDYDENRPLVIWGAGKKGKQLAKKLVEQKIDFHWFSNNEKKNGKMIYDKLLQHFEKINQLEKPQIIVSVASPEGQIEILDFFYKRQMIKGEDYFFFT